MFRFHTTNTGYWSKIDSCDEFQQREIRIFFSLQLRVIVKWVIAFWQKLLRWWLCWDLLEISYTKHVHFCFFSLHSQCKFFAGSYDLKLSNKSDVFYRRRQKWLIQLHNDHCGTKKMTGQQCVHSWLSRHVRPHVADTNESNRTGSCLCLDFHATNSY